MTIVVQSDDFVIFTGTSKSVIPMSPNRRTDECVRARRKWGKLFCLHGAFDTVTVHHPGLCKESSINILCMRTHYVSCGRHNS